MEIVISIQEKSSKGFKNKLKFRMKVITEKKNFGLRRKYQSKEQPCACKYVHTDERRIHESVV